MMFLSRLELDTANRDVARALASPQVMHAIVEGCFMEKSDGVRNLWRLDRLDDRLYLLLKSDDMPDFAPFGGNGFQSRGYSAFLASLREGQLWRFRLCANPVESKAKEGLARGKVMAHVTIEHQKAWLLKKAESCGFAIALRDGEPAFDIVSREIKKFARTGRYVTLSTAVYEGILEVKDPEALARAMAAGIGRGKAYGCGLLTLAKL